MFFDKIFDKTDNPDYVKHMEGSVDQNCSIAKLKQEHEFNEDGHASPIWLQRFLELMLKQIFFRYLVITIKR